MRKLTVFGAVAVLAVVGMTFAALSLLGSGDVEAAKKVGKCGRYNIHADFTASPPFPGSVVIAAGDSEHHGHNVRHLILGGPADQTLHGSNVNRDDIICGGGGIDNINGHAGNDELHGGPGDDIILGSNGDDSLSGGPGGDTLNGGNDTDSCAGGPGVDIITFCESGSAGPQ